MNKTYIHLPVWLTYLLVTACGGGDGSGLDENGNPITETTAAQPLVATLKSIQENIFTPSCAISGCHTEGTAPFGLRLDNANQSAALLINTASFEAPSLLRVAPGDADNSFLVQKLEGTSGIGDQMPLNRTPLSEEQVAVIRQWINEGANADEAAGVTQKAKPLDNVRWQQVQQSVFTPYCVVCHSGVAPPADLNLTADYSYENLVMKRSDPEDPTSPVRVIPGDADGSLLMRKLEGNLAPWEGVAMPLNGDPLAPELQHLVRSWITNGAN